MTSIIGWDIGGANLKAARVEDGVVVAALQRPCAPHAGLGFLEQAIREARGALGPADRHAVTMTAELSDAFQDRAAGVASIAAIFAHEVKAPDVLFYAGAEGFVGKARLGVAARAVASANWRASAALVARNCAEALFVDIGSTTTDIVPIEAGAVAALGADDAGRLAAGELVYTGLLRGSPAAGLPLAPVRGRWTALIGEQFAAMADVHRLLGNIPLGADALTATVDGRPKTIAASRARLARLCGLDAADAADAQWDALARFFAQAQMRQIEDGIALILSRLALSAEAPVVGAGIGRALAAQLARRAGRSFRDFKEFLPALPEAAAAASDCAPACAVALLAASIS